MVDVLSGDGVTGRCDWPDDVGGRLAASEDERVGEARGRDDDAEAWSFLDEDRSDDSVGPVGMEKT